MLKKGKIIKVNSDIFTVKVDDEFIDVKGRGKFRNAKIKLVVGDNVLVDTTNFVIEEVEPRKNYLTRPPVANIDLALIVTSLKKPDINLTLLDKLISIITINNIKPILIFTKLDLASKEELKNFQSLSKYYQKIGYQVLTNNEISLLKKILKDQIVTVCGQTGAGKSTLINKLDKNLHLEVNEISEALGRGKHTTRIVELFQVDNFYIVDTPGFSAIDIDNYTEEEIKQSFVEFRSAQCKFKNCMHENTQDCQVLEDVNNGLILKSRYENYLKFIREP